MRPPHPELSRAPEARLETIEADVRHTPEVAGFQSYESLANNNKAQKEAFIRGEQRHLRLQYPQMTGEGHDRLVALAHATEGSLVTLLGSEDDARTEALFDAIEYRKSEMFLVHMAARMNDESLPAEERLEAAEWFKLANEALYGVPENSMFGAIARTRLVSHLEAEQTDETARRLQTELRERIGVITDEGRELAQPSPEAQERFATLIHEKFDTLTDHIQPRYEADGTTEILYTAEEMVAVITETLHQIGATELGWHCELVPNRELLSISAHQKLVEVGENRDPAGADELRAKVVHEVGVHVLRSVVAEKAGWLSATYGQQRYLDFEEAFANAAGAVYWGSESAANPEYRYLAEGFAYGLDAHEPREMRDTYEIMWRTIALDSRKAGAPMDIEKAKNVAFLQCLRVYRATSTDIPGLTYNKDLAYINGRETVNEVIDLIQTKEDLELLLCGKLDPTQADHLPIAEAIVPGTHLAQRIRARYALAA